MNLDKNIFASLFPHHADQRRFIAPVQQNNMPQQGITGNQPADGGGNGILDYDRAESEINFNADSSEKAKPAPLVMPDEVQKKTFDAGAMVSPGGAGAGKSYAPPEVQMMMRRANDKTQTAFETEAGIEQDPYKQKQRELIDATNAPVKKQKAWQNVLFVAAQAAAHLFGGNAGAPIEFLGEAKKRRGIEKAQDAFAPLQAQRQRELAEMKQRGELQKTALETQKTAVETQKTGAEITNINARTASEVNKPFVQAQTALQKQGDAERDVLSKVYQQEEFDPTAPENKETVERMKKAGVPIIHKRRSDSFSVQVTPNGKMVKINTKTGEVEEMPGDFSKPKTINATDLPDELFGLKSDKEIDAEAIASVGQLPPNRRMRPEIATALPPEYKNPDGSVNEASLLADIAKDKRGVKGLSLGQIYENLPSDYEQKLGKARFRALSEQKGKQQEVARFRTAVEGNNPSSNAKEVSRNDMVDMFNAIMSLPAKDRAPRLTKFYKGLRNFRIQ